MDINYEYFLHYIKQQNDFGNLKILDFGCGQGHVLSLLLDNGINAQGIDVYHQGVSEEILENKLYKAGKIKITKKGDVLPFKDGEFDLIISNQVFEHVGDLDFYFNELGRILKKDGKMYHHFPSREVWREGHIGIPFSHWFIRDSKMRFYYIYLCRLLGFGKKKEGKPVKQWTIDSIKYLDAYCFYKSYDEISTALKDFEIKHKEINYIKFRAKDLPLINLLLKLDLIDDIYEYIFRKLAFMCIVLKKK